MPLLTRAVCSVLAFAVGFAAVWQGRGAPGAGSSEPDTAGAAAPAPPRPARPALRPEPPADGEAEPAASEGAGAPCDAERQATLDYAVRAARAEILTRYGRPPATSLEPPSEAEIDAAFPDALATVVSCTPPPCRLSVATRTRYDDLEDLPQAWGYTNGQVRGGTGRDRVYVLDFAFVDREPSPQEWKLIRNAWTFDGAQLDALLVPILEAGDE